MGTEINPGGIPSKGKALVVGSALVAGIALTGHAVPALTTIPPIRRKLFPKLSGMSESGAIALTFDDGPDAKSTPLFLDLLDKHGWKATFFMLGRMAEKDPPLAREVLARGHEIALHGYKHNNLLWKSPKATNEDIRRSFGTISEIVGTHPRYFRPPYGVFNAQALLTANDLHLTPMLWTAWGRDWRAKATPQTVFNDLAKGIRPGSTLLLHDSDCTSAKDSYYAALGAMELLAERTRARRLHIERLCDHFPD
ncbi:MAG: polysaccharide deacetylase family protein [Actinomycetota bacterium]|nr:polysaccharide deacetylase family protein [Actinomycetota bacterium]